MSVPSSAWLKLNWQRGSRVSVVFSWRWLRKARPLHGESALQRLFFRYLGQVAKLAGAVQAAQIRQLEQEMRRLGFGSMAVDWVATACSQGKQQSSEQVRTQLQRAKLNAADRSLWLAAGWRMAYASAAPSTAQQAFLQQLAQLWQITQVSALQFAQEAEQQAKARPLLGRQAALQVLGLNYAAQWPEIKRAYRRLTSQLHPDKYAAVANAQQVQQITARLIEVQQAYQYLKQQAQRGV